MAIGMATIEESEVGAVNDKFSEDLCTRTPWADAKIALDHIRKGRATGNRRALVMRRWQQEQFVLLASFVACHSGKILFLALLVGASLCVGLKTSRLVTDLDELWVEEGGRLENELDYISKMLGDGAGTTNQILIQTSKESSGANMLSSSSLLTHLNILSSATSVSVDLFDISWSLNDLCFATNFPSFENQMIDQIFERLTPCAIITPLDCFWEGSKLLGPDYPVRIPGFGERKWTNINPQAIVDKMKETPNASSLFPLTSFSKFLKRAGISTAYQYKPCLDPRDPDCPETAPNKHSNESVDIGAELTGGCYGFASKFLHWPEQLIVGGTTLNRTNHIKRAEAFQSVVQLMGERDLFEYWKEDYKVHHIDWSKEKAKLILNAWVHKFSKTVEEETNYLNRDANNYNIYPFSSVILSDLLKKMSVLPVTRIGIGYAVMTVYVCLCLVNLRRKEESSIGLALAGMILVAGAVASGLGLCALLGLPFNSATLQILPFLALGLGINNVFVLVNSVCDVFLQAQTHEKLCIVEEALKRSGSTVLLSSLCTGGSFFTAALIPVPALRLLCLQAGLLILVILIAVLTVFPAVMFLDTSRRRAQRMDILCCISQSNNDEEGNVQQVHDGNKKYSIAPKASSPTGGTVAQSLCSRKSPQECWVGVSPLNVADASHVDPTELCRESLIGSQFHCDSFIECGCWSLQKFIRKMYAPALCQRKVKLLTILMFIASIITSIYGGFNIREGLDTTDIVPRGTIESYFLEAQERYFGFYNIFVITQGNFEYPTKQRILHEYHQSFNRIPWILKNDDGGLPETWLSLFRDWLLELQGSFDQDWKLGHINETSWSREAADEAILAYKLLVQTGHVDHPVDLGLITQNRLVDEDGNINSKAFYNYLTVWYSNDPLTYSASQADIRPIPRVWHHDARDTDMKIPKSSPIVYAQFPFLLHNLKDTQSVTAMITYVRDICKKFEDQGLPNFPAGQPFTYWEQYIRLRFYLFLAVGALFGGIFLLLCVSLMNLWASALFVLFLAFLLIQLFGLLGLMGLKLSALSAALLVISVGIGAQLTLPILLAFLSAVGSRNKRVQIATEMEVVQAIQKSFSLFLAILMLLFSEFDFIRRYFFYVLGVMVLLGLIHALIFLPVILSLIGSPAEVVPKFAADRLPLPTPTPSPQLPTTSSHQSNHRSHSHNGKSKSKNARRHSNLKGSFPNLSLTTISEESTSAGDSNQLRSSCQEIIVEPQVVVETTTHPAPESARHSAETVVCCDGGHVTTTVTATAKVKVEVHNQLNGCVDISTKCTSDSQSNTKTCCGQTERSHPTRVVGNQKNDSNS